MIEETCFNESHWLEDLIDLKKDQPQNKQQLLKKALFDYELQ